MEEFLDDSSSNSHSHSHSQVRLFCLVGPSKSGKTTYVKTLLERKGYDYLRPDSNQFASNKQFEECIENFIFTHSINFDSPTLSTKPKVLFIDDIEVFMCQNKLSKTFLCKLLTCDCNFKCIITCSPAHEKKLHDIKKTKIEFVVERLTESSAEHESEYADKSLYEIVHKLFMNQEKSVIQDIEMGISSDPLLLSFTMYDNAHKFLDSKGLGAMYKVFCEMSTIEDFAFKTGDWSLIDMYALIQCGTIRAKQQQQQQKSSNISITAVDNPTNIMFTQIPCRSSQRFCVMKKQQAYMSRHGLTYNNLTFISSLNSSKLDLRTERGQVIHALWSNFAIPKTRRK